jgi:hypothetical protein
LILLAQTRQADRVKVLSEADANHREPLAKATVERQEIAIHHTVQMHELLEANTRLTEQVERLTKEIHAGIVNAATGG